MIEDQIQKAHFARSKTGLKTICWSNALRLLRGQPRASRFVFVSLAKKPGSFRQVIQVVLVRCSANAATH